VSLRIGARADCLWSHAILGRAASVGALASPVGGSTDPSERPAGSPIKP
jgi:hypothetical protein